MRYLIAGFVLAAAFAAASPASAYVVDARQEAPWCAVIEVGTGNVRWECNYASIEACRPNVIAGNRGFCNPNPYFVGYAGPVVRVRHHRRHVRHW